MRGENPYVGPRPFSVEEQDIFFGRDREIQHLTALCLSNQLVVLYGQSGVGKSSLVQAGLLPALRSKGIDPLPVGSFLRTSTEATAALPHYNPLITALASTWFPGSTAERATDVALGDLLRVHRSLSLWETGRATIGVIDQVDSILYRSVQPSTIATDLVVALSRAVSDQPEFRLLIVVRETTLSELLHELAPTSLIPRLFQLEALGSAQAAKAIAGPAKLKSLRFAPDAVDELLKKISPSASSESSTASPQPIELAQLQVVCRDLWQNLPEHLMTVNRSHVRAYADTWRAMHNFCSGALVRVAQDLTMRVEVVMYYMSEIIHSSIGTATAPNSESSQAATRQNSVLMAELEDAYLVKSTLSGEGPRFELAGPLIVEQFQRGVQIIDEDDEIEGNDPPAASVALALAERAYVQNEIDLAEKHIDQILTDYENCEVRIRAASVTLLGNIAFQRGYPDDAERYYRQAAELYEELQDSIAVGRLLAAIGRILASRGSYAAAIEELSVASSRSGADLLIQLDFASILWASGHPRAAAAVFSGVLANAPDTVEALVGRAQIEVELEDVSAALEDFGSALRLWPNIIERDEVRAAKALAVARSGQTSDALSEADAIMMAQPSSGPALFRLALIYGLAGQEEQARSTLRAARVATEPPLPPYQYAQVSTLLGDVSSEGREPGLSRPES